MDTLVQLHDGAETTISELKESQLASTQRVEPEYGAQFLAWEVLRERIVL